MHGCTGHHNHCQKEALAHLESYCAKHKLRLTKMRRKVFEMIWQNHRALTATEIMQKLGNNQPPMTYRALEFLTEHHLIHKITSLNAYVGCNHPEDQAHSGQMLICTTCHNVKEIESQALPTFVQEAQANGFTPIQTQIEMLGTCDACISN